MWMVRRFFFFFFKQKTAYEIPKRDWSSDVCSSDLKPSKSAPDSTGGGHPMPRSPETREERPMLPAKFGLRTIVAGAIAALAPGATGALARPVPWEMNFQPAVTPVMESIEQFHVLLLWIITAISLIVRE